MRFPDNCVVVDLGGAGDFTSIAQAINFKTDVSYVLNVILHTKCDQQSYNDFIHNFWFGYGYRIHQRNNYQSYDTCTGIYINVNIWPQ